MISPSNGTTAGSGRDWRGWTGIDATKFMELYIECLEGHQTTRIHNLPVKYGCEVCGESRLGDAFRCLKCPFVACLHCCDGGIVQDPSIVTTEDISTLLALYVDLPTDMCGLIAWFIVSPLHLTISQERKLVRRNNVDGFYDWIGEKDDKPYYKRRGTIETVNSTTPTSQYLYYCTESAAWCVGAELWTTKCYAWLTMDILLPTSSTEEHAWYAQKNGIISRDLTIRVSEGKATEFPFALEVSNALYLSGYYLRIGIREHRPYYKRITCEPENATFYVHYYSGIWVISETPTSEKYHAHNPSSSLTPLSDDQNINRDRTWKFEYGNISIIKGRGQGSPKYVEILDCSITFVNGFYDRVEERLSIPYYKRRGVFEEEKRAFQLHLYFYGGAWRISDHLFTNRYFAKTHCGALSPLTECIGRRTVWTVVTGKGLPDMEEKLQVVEGTLLDFPDCIRVLGCEGKPIVHGFFRKVALRDGRPYYKRLGKGKCDGKMEDFYIYYKDGFWVIGANLWSLCAIASLQSHVLVPLRKYVYPIADPEFSRSNPLPLSTKWKVYSENRFFDLDITEGVYKESPNSLVVCGVRPPRICTPNGVYKKVATQEGRPYYKNVQEKNVVMYLYYYGSFWCLSQNLWSDSVNARTLSIAISPLDIESEWAVWAPISEEEWDWHSCKDLQIGEGFVPSPTGYEIQECIDEGVCTFSRTSDVYFEWQLYYTCETCQIGLIVDGFTAGVCETCVTKCHSGHETKLSGIMHCFCVCRDCGPKTCLAQ